MKKLMIAMICLMIAVITWKDGSTTTVQFEKKNTYNTFTTLFQATGSREYPKVVIQHEQVRMIEYREGNK